jgi:LmbE family N-acetylglucosaminyl deacetylase
MAAGKTFRIVAAVCHPDDEAIWIGGLLYELSKIPFIECHVVCLSGNDPASPRVAEFERARNAAGYKSGVIMGGPLRPALTPLPDNGAVLEKGLAQLGLAVEGVDLVITHAPYGDEQGNPHHSQSHREIKAWCDRRNVPFGYFSCYPIPYFQHIPVADALYRAGTFHLLHWSRCSPALGLRRLDPAFRRYGCPRYFVQFLTDGDAKARMLAAYQSIGPDSHAQNYSMFTNSAEALYLMDERAFAPVRAVIAAMTTPSVARPFRRLPLANRIAKKLQKILDAGG